MAKTRGRKTAMSKPIVTRPQGAVTVDAAGILADLRELIHSARHRVATVANAEQTLLYWRLGKRIAIENLTEGRAEYGKQILATVSQELMAEFGRGFTYTAIIRMLQFYQAFPEEQIVTKLSAQLGWSHFIEILPIKPPLAREFYAEMCRVERWPVRTLRQKISGMLYERTALSKNTEAVIKAELENLREGEMTPDMVFRDPYLLDFLGLQGAFSEKDLENAILREIERFLLELDEKSIRVAEYLTELPPIELLRSRLHLAIELAREQAARRIGDGE
jgi:predicted nuclease of restriction endonuclease-like (RecB) superfamily